MSGGRTIIHQSENVMLIGQEAGSSDVVVTFNELGTVYNGDRFWGDTFLNKMGVSALGFVTPRPNWYPIDEMIEAIAAARAFIGGRKTITYGHSQGGYGALKFSSALSASIALSFCPQWSIDPAECGSDDPRFTKHHRPSLRNGSKITAADVGSSAYLFYDPLEKHDTWNAEILFRLPGVTSIPAPFSGHHTIRVITESKSASRLIEAARRGAGAIAFRSIVREARGASKTYQVEKTRALIRRSKIGDAFLNKHLDQTATGPWRIIYSACSNSFKGDSVAAAELIAQIPDADFLEMDLLDLWTIFRQARLAAGELRVATLLPTKHPKAVFIRLHAVNTYINRDMPENALSELGGICELEDSSRSADLIAGFYKLLRRPDLLELFLGRIFAAGLPEDRRLLLKKKLANAYEFAEAETGRAL